MIWFALICLFLTFSPCMPQVVEEVVKAEVAAPALGGWYPLPLDSKKAVMLTDFSKFLYNKKSPSPYLYRTKELVNGMWQVVNGLNYKLSIILEPTGCLKEEHIENEECTIPNENEQQVVKCLFYIVERMQEIKPALLYQQCVPVRK